MAVLPAEHTCTGQQHKFMAHAITDEAEKPIPGLYNLA
jgi:hypothetical protein